MIIIDANILLYAYNSSAPLHNQARQWVEKTFSAYGHVGIPWVCILAFIRIITNHRATKYPLSISEASNICASWFELDNIIKLQAGDRHWEILHELLIKAKVSGPLVTDAHLAALAIENDALLCSTDRDFTRFPNLRFSNPLE